jgi:hypothetical protein
MAGRKRRRAGLMKRLLVASVYAQSERNAVWLSLQRRFLARTTADYDHAVFLNREDGALFRGCLVIGRDAGGEEGSEEHANALRQVLSYCQAHRYEGYLILDSDCFPVADWQERLAGLMGRFPLAAAVRVENFDLFPHPCAFFVRGDAIAEPYLDFAVTPHRNLLGEELRDTACAIPLGQCFPLLRSNVWNPHPIFAGVYGHMFYHHGAGSRASVTRGLLSGYYDHILPPAARPDVEGALFRRLVRRPEAFVSRLLGRGLVPRAGWLRRVARALRRLRLGTPAKPQAAESGQAAR